LIDLTADLTGRAGKGANGSGPKWPAR
jgi:hypothetical protein